MILIIDTSSDNAFIILSHRGTIVETLQNNFQKDHASFLQPAIKKICAAAMITLSEIEAVAVVNGPGSYTGLRVGLAAAKAICYVLNKPLILLNTLDVMAYALKLQSAPAAVPVLFCPMTDARRNEIFTALYDINLHLLKNYSATIADETFLKEERKTCLVVCGGSGIKKVKEITTGENLIFIDTLLLLNPLAALTEKAFLTQNFSNIAYCEPYYIKPVYFKI